MAETWLFMDSGDLTPEMNMAVDDLLLTWHSRGDLPPILRFYGWGPPGLSLGYFQKVDGKIDVAAAKRHGFGIVRRPTGGRAVLHDKELTYSVIVSEDHDKMPRSVTDAYRVISRGLLEGFRNLNINADFSIPEGKASQSGSAVCFEEPSWYELIVEGKKAAGSAQTRQKGVILQHGSIPIEVDTLTLFDLFIYPNERVKERARKAFGGKAAAINEVAKNPKTLQEVKTAFKKGFETGLEIELKPYELSEQQWEEARNLVEERYGNESWTYSR